jgi:outer membrane receptor protein involved in Fe transport
MDFSGGTMKALRLFIYLGIFICSISATNLLVAQTYEGRILGTVTDQSGAAINDAKVVITNVDTGIFRELATNDAGDYVAPNLAPGVYKVVVDATGFSRSEKSGARLEVAKDVRIDFNMHPGSMAETVNVTEDVSLVETTNDTLGGTFTNKSINDLPLNGRDFQNLVVLRPGVQRSSGGGFLSISSNGNRPEDNNFILDGTDNNDPYYGTTVINAEGVQGTPGTILPIDAIQEFNAQENPPAEYGWKPGAIINLGIKSGTNNVHGSAYGFERNSAFDARNFFNTEPDPQRALRQHQFGGSIGAPIIKNKTFIFGAYEAIRALVGNSNGAFVPVSTSLGGDPSNSIPDALTELMAQPGAGAPTFTCAGVPVNSNVLNPLSANLIGCGSFTGNGAYPGLLPANDGANGENINSGFPNTNRMDAFIIKVDHHFNERHSISGRYFFGDSLQTEQDITVLRPEWESQSKLQAQVFGFNYTWVPNASWVNEARFGYNRFWQTILTADHALDPATTYGINAGVTSPINFGMPTILIGGFTQIGGNSGWPLETIPNQTYQIVDNVSYTHGKHTFRFGGEYRLGKSDNIRDRRGKGRIRFQNGGNTFDSSTALEDFLAGNPDRGDIFVGDSERRVSIKSFGAFLQDDWRVTPHLTVNLGVRYDFTSVPKEEKNQLGNFDPAVGLQQVGVNIKEPFSPDRNNFAPRLGISWDPFGKGKTVLRAGAGMTYEYPHLSTFLGQNGVNNATTPGINVIPTGAIGSNLEGNGGTIVAASTTQRSGLNWSADGPVFNVAVDCTSSPCDILGVRHDLKAPYVWSWNFNIQQALSPSTSLQVAYVGNRGVKLYSVRDINQVDPVSAAEIACGHCEQDGRPFATAYPFLEFVNFLENGDGSIYHGLQATFTQRFWKGLNFVAGYTWSHAIDDVSLNRAAQPQDSTRPGLERASGDSDLRHRFTLALTYDLPSRKGYAQLLEGWQMNSIVTLQGGQPFTAVDFENDTSLTGEFSDRWNAIGNPKSIRNWTIDPNNPIDVSSVLQQPTNCDVVACFGNGGRNTFRGPGYRNWDFSIVKRFRFTETIDLQFRAEFFNVLNHPNFANPAILFTNDLGFLDSFGVVNATPDVAAANPVIGSGGPRNIQLGLKIRF